MSWFPRTAVVKSQLPRHLPNIVSFLMGRASSPEAHYSCGSQFDRHGQCGDSSQPGASYWLVGVEAFMTSHESVLLGLERPPAKSGTKQTELLCCMDRCIAAQAVGFMKRI